MHIAVTASNNNGSTIARSRATAIVVPPSAPTSSGSTTTSGTAVTATTTTSDVTTTTNTTTTTTPATTTTPTVPPPSQVWTWDAATAPLDPNSAALMQTFLGYAVVNPNLILNDWGVATAETDSASPCYSVPLTDGGPSTRRSASRSDAATQLATAT